MQYGAVTYSKCEYNCAYRDAAGESFTSAAPQYIAKVEALTKHQEFIFPNFVQKAQYGAVKCSMVQ